MGRKVKGESVVIPMLAVKANWGTLGIVSLIL
jgi:hypothetical protein